MSAQPAYIDAEMLLAEARDAWRTRICAQATLSRLAAYRGQSAGMKYDAAKATERLSKANETLERILGGAR